MNDQLQDAERVAKGAEPHYTREQYESVMFAKAESAARESGEGVANAFSRLCGEGEFDSLYAAGQAADIAEEQAVISKADPEDRFTPLLMRMAKMNRREGETLEACASRLLVEDEVVAAAYASTQGL